MQYPEAATGRVSAEDIGDITARIDDLERKAVASDIAMREVPLPAASVAEVDEVAARCDMLEISWREMTKRLESSLGQPEVIPGKPPGILARLAVAEQQLASVMRSATNEPAKREGDAVNREEDEVGSEHEYNRAFEIASIASTIEDRIAEVETRYFGAHESLKGELHRGNSQMTGRIRKLEASLVEAAQVSLRFCGLEEEMKRHAVLVNDLACLVRERGFICPASGECASSRTGFNDCMTMTESTCTIPGTAKCPSSCGSELDKSFRVHDAFSDAGEASFGPAICQTSPCNGAPGTVWPTSQEEAMIGERAEELRRLESIGSDRGRAVFSGALQESLQDLVKTVNRTLEQQVGESDQRSDATKGQPTPKQAQSRDTLPGHVIRQSSCATMGLPSPPCGPMGLPSAPSVTRGGSMHPSRTSITRGSTSPHGGDCQPSVRQADVQNQSRDSNTSHGATLQQSHSQPTLHSRRTSYPGPGRCAVTSGRDLNTPHIASPTSAVRTVAEDPFCIGVNPSSSTTISASEDMTPSRSCAVLSSPVVVKRKLTDGSPAMPRALSPSPQARHSIGSSIRRVPPVPLINVRR